MHELMEAEAMSSEVKKGGSSNPHKPLPQPVDTPGARNSWSDDADPFPAVMVYQPLFIYAQSHKTQLQDLLSAIREVENTALKTTAANALWINDHKGSIAELRTFLEQVLDDTFLSSPASTAAMPKEMSITSLKQLTGKHARQLLSAPDTTHSSETAAGKALLALPDAVTACAVKLRGTKENYTNILTEGEQASLDAAAEKCDAISSEMLDVRKRAMTPERSFSETFERIARGHGYPYETPSR
ncbi:MAG: hypothetical protein SFX19_08700 [Alphaproteobacteria bacterium]|nr:hypothetical protein [Alphaproteobacteria bacterium]